MRRCFTDPPLLEEPCAQTLSGKTKDELNAVRCSVIACLCEVAVFSNQHGPGRQSRAERRCLTSSWVFQICSVYVFLKDFVVFVAFHLRPLVPQSPHVTTAG